VHVQPPIIVDGLDTAEVFSDQPIINVNASQKEPDVVRLSPPKKTNEPVLICSAKEFMSPTRTRPVSETLPLSQLET
jgi:hypothetical protein